MVGPMLIEASHSPWHDPGTYMVVIAGLGLIGAAALVKLGMWIGGANKQVTAVEKHVEGAEKHMSAVERLLQEIREDIKRLLRWSETAAAGGSPLRLTDLGRRISDMLDAPAWARETAPILRPRVEGEPPYEVHDACFAFVEDEFEPSDEFHVTIRMCAYELGIDRAEVNTVLAITLRDELLEPSPSPSEAPA